MRIKNIKINAYGNLQDKEIELCDGINVIYGKNEAGKSTLLKFITNILYGTSKNKKGREYSDYDKYKPWNKEEFSGKVMYMLDNGEKYEVYREFGKKNPKIYNANMEDISKQYNVDKNIGNQFFVEQTKVDEDTFMSTFVSMQQEVKLDNVSQNVLIQKIANLAGTGDDNISYKKSIDKLTKKQLEEIGSNRSQGKPINIITNKIAMLKDEKNQLEKYKDYKYEIENSKNRIESEIVEKIAVLNILQDIQKLNTKEKIDFEPIELSKKTIIKNSDQNKNYFDQIVEFKKRYINEEPEKEYTEYSLEDFKKYGTKIFKYEDESETKQKEKIKIDDKEIKSKTKKGIFIVAFIIMLLGLVLDIGILKTAIISYVCTASMLVDFVLYFIYKKLVIRKIKNKIQDEQNNHAIEVEFENSKICSRIDSIKQQMEKNNENNIKEENEIENISEKIKNEMSIEIQTIIDKYNSKIEKEIIEDFFKKYLTNRNKQIQDVVAKKSELCKHNQNKLMYFISLPCNENVGIIERNLINKINEVTHEVNEQQLELHRLDLNKENIIPKVDNLSNIEEQLVACDEEYTELLNRNECMNYIRTFLENAYEKMKNTVTPKFTENLSRNIKEISNDKYQKVTINDENGLMVEIQSGEYISAEKLSLGTIDQLYLSLRLSMLNEISNETLPIILDESFAYYDDERLKNVLKFINSNFGNRQILILTCTNREEEIFQKNGIQYNKINL